MDMPGNSRLLGSLPSCHSIDAGLEIGGATPVRRPHPVSHVLLSQTIAYAVIHCSSQLVTTRRSVRLVGRSPQSISEVSRRPLTLLDAGARESFREGGDRPAVDLNVAATSISSPVARPANRGFVVRGERLAEVRIRGAQIWLWLERSDSYHPAVAIDALAPHTFSSTR